MECYRDLRLARASVVAIALHGNLSALIHLNDHVWDESGMIDKTENLITNLSADQARLTKDSDGIRQEYLPRYLCRLTLPITDYRQRRTKVPISSTDVSCMGNPQAFALTLLRKESHLDTLHRPRMWRRARQNHGFL